MVAELFCPFRTFTDGWSTANGIKSAVWFASISHPSKFGLVTTADVTVGQEVCSHPPSALCPTAGFSIEITLLNTSGKSFLFFTGDAYSTRLGTHV